jgi:O-antigen/teichoic acid export membrane protein
MTDVSAGEREKLWPVSKRRRLIELGILYAGKSGAVVIGVVFLPIFHRLLGNEAFGVVAVILSFLAFSLMADIGMATLVSRDLAYHHNSVQGLVTLRDAEIALILIYGGGLILILTICILIGISTSKVQIIIGCALLFLLSVLQNLELSALQARKQYIVAGATQLVGVISRALITVAALILVSATLLTFIGAQLTGIALHFGLTRFYSRRLLAQVDDKVNPEPTWLAIRRLISRGAPLLFTGLAGAAVMQLDKPLVSAFMPPSAVSPYFLAMTFSALPASLLAGPVVQYFQPQVIQAMAVGDNTKLGFIIKQFTLTLILLVALPSWIIWQSSEPIISLWLHDKGLASIVSSYVRVLLPAFVVGSLCYVPVVLLMAVQDFKYQAFTSMAMTAITLIAVAFYANAGRIDSVVFVYFLYFITASISVWWRSLSLSATRRMAKLSAAKSLYPLVVLLLTAIVFMLLK